LEEIDARFVLFVATVNKAGYPDERIGFVRVMMDELKETLLGKSRGVLNVWTAGVTINELLLIKGR
jgi:hypothetical protein